MFGLFVGDPQKIFQNESVMKKNNCWSTLGWDYGTTGPPYGCGLEEYIIRKAAGPFMNQTSSVIAIVYCKYTIRSYSKIEKTIMFKQIHKLFFHTK